jgi:hypothetical protein
MGNRNRPLVVVTLLLIIMSQIILIGALTARIVLQVQLNRTISEQVVTRGK